MNRRQLRARVVLEEACVLGVDLADLMAADSIAAAQLPTVNSYLEAVAPTFTVATARTYRPYWRLAATHIGDRRLSEVTVGNLVAVVDDAVARAQSRRPQSTGQATRESCVAALRALFRRARDAGLSAVNPAAALSKPRRDPQPPPGTGRRRAWRADRRRPHHQQRPPPRPPRAPVHLESGARRQGALSLLQPRPRRHASNGVAARRRESANVSNPSPLHSSPGSSVTPSNRGRLTSTERSSAPQTAFRCRPAATARSSTEPEPAWTGPTAPQCPPTSCATPPSPPSGASPATPSPRPSPVTRRRR